MLSGVVVARVFGILVLAVILYGAKYEVREKNERQETFIFLTLGTMAVLALDLVRYLPLNLDSWYILRYALPLLTLAAPLALYVVFLHYVYLHVSSRAAISHNLFLVNKILCGVGIVATVYYGLVGKLFTFADSVFTQGEFFEGYLLIYLIIMGYTVAVLLANIRKIGLHDTIATVMFIMIPVVFIVLNIFVPSCSFAIPSLALSMLIINTMLQMEQQQSLIANEEESSRLAHNDELTGLPNRLAFNELCDSLQGDDLVGVVFADVNGLKYTNDHYGHKAGDAQLRGFATVMQSCFRKNEVFRISGDEFVAIVRGIPKETFERKMRELKQKNNVAEKPMASIGYVHGSASRISTLLDLAEKEMYAQKQMIHRLFPASSRN